MYLLSHIVYSCKTLNVFRTVFPSIIKSSKLRLQQRYMLNSCCCSSSYFKYTVVVYAVLSSWWWTERQSEICTAFCKNKQFEITGASCWLYYGTVLRCTDPWILDLSVPNRQKIHMDIETSKGSSSCLIYTAAVYAVLSSWWWTERPSETRRAFCQE